MEELDRDYGNTRTVVEHIEWFLVEHCGERTPDEHRRRSMGRQRWRMWGRKCMLIGWCCQSFYSSRVLALSIMLADSRCASSHHIDGQYAGHQFQLQPAKLTAHQGSLTIWHIHYLLCFLSSDRFQEG